MNRLVQIMIYIFMFYFLACIPSIFVDQKIHIQSFIHTLEKTGINMLHFNDIVFVNQKSGVRHSIFPFIFEPWMNTLAILFGAIFVALIISIIIGYLLFRYKRFNHYFMLINRFLSVIPDIFYIPIAITVVIIIYKSSSILLFDVASTSEKSAIIFPIILLSIIPITNTLNLIDQLIKKEKNTTYVEFAMSKGVSSVDIYYHHILRNVLIGYVINMQQILWITLSSTLFLERIMNLFGISVFIFEYHSPEVLLIAFILLYVPIALFLTTSNIIVKRYTGVSVG